MGIGQQSAWPVGQWGGGGELSRLCTLRPMSKRDESSENFQRIRRYRPKRSVIRTLTDLTPSPDAKAAYEARFVDDAPEFADGDLQELHDRGILRLMRRQLKSGKEATVYIGDGDLGRIAVKLYHDIEARSFRNDAQYSAGRYIGDLRIQRAIAQGSKAGLAARLALWVQNEFNELEMLHAAGVPVPRPIAHSGKAIAMEFVGDGLEPAPRLSEVRLTRIEATDALNQAVTALAGIVACGRVHGDYSTFNLLWSKRRVIVIDLPQLIAIDENPDAAEFLKRDIDSLCTTFARFHIDIDRAAIARTVVPLTGRDLIHSPLRSVRTDLRGH